MPRRSSQPANLPLDLAALWFEAGWTIALRTAQFWSGTSSPAELSRMVSEKPKAFADAAIDASAAWARSLARPARRNRRRLTRRKLRKTPFKR